MPSPFPGMDPYLENPNYWPNVHHGLISELQAELNRQLRPKYFANIEERVYLSDQNDPGRDFIVPDVHVVARTPFSTGRKTPSIHGVITIEPLEVTTLLEDEVHEARIEIVDTQNRTVVTVIEILSPTNKINGSYGRDSYQNKRREVMSSRSHLIEIDLLRSGMRIYIREQIPRYDYLVHVSRAPESSHRRATIWPIPMALPLPVIPVPLKRGDVDAHINLQAILNNAYERGAFDLKVNYNHDPIPPLTVDQAAWAKAIVSTRPPES